MKNITLVALFLLTGLINVPAIFSDDGVVPPPDKEKEPVVLVDFLHGNYNADAIFKDNDPAQKVNYSESVLVVTATKDALLLPDGSVHPYKVIESRQLGEKLFAFMLETDLPNYYVVVVNEGWGNHAVLQEAVIGTNVLVHMYTIMIDKVK